MGLFDKVKDAVTDVASKVKEGADAAADKAKDFAETTKLNAQISQAEKGIKDVYTEIGKLFMEKFPDTVKEKFPEQIGKIDGFKETIAKAKDAIAALAKKAEDKVEEVAEEVKETAEEVVEAAGEKVEEVKEAVADKIDEIK